MDVKVRSDGGGWVGRIVTPRLALILDILLLDGAIQ